MARSIECKCDSRFTCGYCLRNAKPYPSTSYNPNLVDASLGFVGSLDEELTNQDFLDAEEAQ